MTTKSISKPTQTRPYKGLQQGLHDKVYTLQHGTIPNKDIQLITLAFKNSDNSLTLNQFADLQNVSRQALYKRVNRLIKKGLIKRDNLGAFTTLRIPKAVINILKLGGGLPPKGFTSFYTYIDDFELSVPYSINPIYNYKFDNNEFWNLSEGPNKAQVYKGIRIIKGNTKPNGTGRVILRVLGKTFGANKEEILINLQDRVNEAVQYLQTHFKSLSFGEIKARLNRMGKVVKIEFEIADPLSEALYNTLGPGEHTLLRHKDGKAELQVHKSDKKERLYTHPKTFDTLSETLENRVFIPYREHTALYPDEVTKNIQALTVASQINIMQTNGATLKDMAAIAKNTKYTVTNTSQAALMLEIIRAENPKLAQAVEDNPELQAHLFIETNTK